MKIVEQARKGDDPVLVFGTLNVLREMDVRHPAALFVQELVEGHHKAFGMGCTTLVAWIGLFAAVILGLVHRMRIQPGVVASTLAEIRDCCIEQLALGDPSRADRERRDSPVLHLSQLIDEYLAAQPAALVASTLGATAMPAAPARPLPFDDEADWFFDDADDMAEPEQLDPSSLLSSTTVTAAPAPAPALDTLLGFLASLGGGLSHGQDESMDAAVRVVHRLLRADGIKDAVQLRRALLDADQIDLTEQWDLSSMITLQAKLGPSNASAPAAAASPGSSSSPSSRYELVEGVLLDLSPQEVPYVRAIISRAQTTSAAATTVHRPLAPLSADDAIDVGVVLVLGDVSAPDSSAAISVAPSSASSSSSPGSAVRAAMDRAERRKDAYLSRLAARLHSLRVTLVLCKGSFNKDVQAHLKSRGVICLETVNLPQLESASRVAVAPLVCLLADVDEAHVGRARVALRWLGWNPSLAHRHVAREVDRDSASADQRSECKLVLTPELQSSSSAAAPASHPPLTLFSTHATAIDARRFATSFWNCANRLRHALRDRCVCRGGGAVQRAWIGAIERRAQRIREEIAQQLHASLATSSSSSSSSDADALLDARSQSLSVHQSLGSSFRHYLQLLLTNADEGTEEQRWVEVHGATLATRVVDSDGPGASSLYDNRDCSVSALSTCVYLFQMFLHVDATLSCQNGRTLYQLMEGRKDQAGRTMRVL